MCFYNTGYIKSYTCGELKMNAVWKRVIENMYFKSCALMLKSTLELKRGILGIIELKSIKVISFVYICDRRSLAIRQVYLKVLYK